MDKDKKNKLLELRKKKNASKQQSADKKHQELLEAIQALHGLFEQQDVRDTKNTEALLTQLESFTTFKKEVASVRKAVENIPSVDTVKVENLSDIVFEQNEVDMSGVIAGIRALIKAIEAQTVDEVKVTNQKASDYIPIRRVVKLNTRYVYDDVPTSVSMIGGGSTINNYNKDQAVDVRFEPDETAPLYIGTHNDLVDAPTDNKNWYIAKFTRVDGKAVRIQRRKGSWDDRAIGW